MGWGIIEAQGIRMTCRAYGCIETSGSEEITQRLHTIYEQTTRIIERYTPEYVSIETVWFGQNITAAFGTGQARGAALAACGSAGLGIAEFAPLQIKANVVGQGDATKEQVQYMVKQILNLDHIPRPDHAADALAAAICMASNNVFSAEDFAK
ncbi:MAG: crossover junction endodeoxyribonuclease RuvC [Eggerthellaceae bacterium]|nr:crossover junction endodeoxyribonuclease RuvC [Eggerthellaceae bacterium]